jgi:hypothetical protein
MPEEKLYIAVNLGLTPDTKRTYEVSRKMFFARNKGEAIRKATNGTLQGDTKATFVFEAVAKIDRVERRSEKRKAWLKGMRG